MVFVVAFAVTVLSCRNEGKDQKLATFEGLGDLRVLASAAAIH